MEEALASPHAILTTMPFAQNEDWLHATALAQTGNGRGMRVVRQFAIAARVILQATAGEVRTVAGTAQRPARNGHVGIPAVPITECIAMLNAISVIHGYVPSIAPPMDSMVTRTFAPFQALRMIMPVVHVAKQTTALQRDRCAIAVSVAAIQERPCVMELV